MRIAAPASVQNPEIVPQPDRHGVVGGFADAERAGERLGDQDAAD